MPDSCIDWFDLLRCCLLEALVHHDWLLLSRQQHHAFAGKDKTKYTDKPVAEGATVGGSSWTKEWLKFDNSYFKMLKEQDDKDLLVLETDGVLMTDPNFR